MFNGYYSFLQKTIVLFYPAIIFQLKRSPGAHQILHVLSILPVLKVWQNQRGCLEIWHIAISIGNYFAPSFKLQVWACFHIGLFFEFWAYMSIFYTFWLINEWFYLVVIIVFVFFSAKVWLLNVSTIFMLFHLIKKLICKYLGTWCYCESIIIALLLPVICITQKAFILIWNKTIIFQTWIIIFSHEIISVKMVNCTNCILK